MRLAFLMLIAAAATSPACAQLGPSVDRWPDRPIRFIVPFPAGSSTDIVARIVGHALSDRLGQQLVLDNRPGGSGNLGSDVVARAAPDGYTIGLATISTHAVAPSLNPQLTYDPVKDFAPVSMIGSSPYVLAVYPGVPAKSVAELIALAKAKPRALNYASAGPASMAHLAGALFASMAQVELTHVPYRSSNQAVLDLTEGRIEIQFGTLAPTIPFVTTGKLRVLATTGTSRAASLPDVPTLSESGLPGYEVSIWMAIVMPAATPPAIVARLNRELTGFLSSPEGKQALAEQGLDAEPSTPDALRNRIGADIEKWRAVVRRAGIQLEQ
jgi:tripartite-type tricarboxylate transporter receptor subunit TctC